MGETTGGTLRRSSDRIVAGVCAGLGDYFHIDPLLVRVVFVILALANGIGILLYLVLWLLMDPPLGAPATGRHLGERMRAMGNELRDEMRTGFSWTSSSPAPSGPSSPIPPSSQPAPGEAGSPVVAPTHPQHRGLWFGAILIVLGAYLLVQNLGVFNAFRWDIWFWPAVLIAIGLIILFRRR